MSANNSVCDEDPGLRIESFAVINLRGDWCLHKHNYYMFIGMQIKLAKNLNVLCLPKSMEYTMLYTQYNVKHATQPCMQRQSRCMGLKRVDGIFFIIDYASFVMYTYVRHVSNALKTMSSTLSLVFEVTWL